MWVVLFGGAFLTIGFTFFFGAENLRAQSLMILIRAGHRTSSRDGAGDAGHLNNSETYRRALALIRSSAASSCAITAPPQLQRQ
jgi:hypothetical protein